MVMTFFRRGDGDSGLDQITARTVSMVSDAHHSFDLASTALLSGANVDIVGEDVRQTDDRINAAEQELRGQLVVHVSVQGSGDIGEVLGLILLIKKIERIGDHVADPTTWAAYATAGVRAAEPIYCLDFLIGIITIIIMVKKS